jgi:hypothetical protein
MKKKLAKLYLRELADPKVQEYIAGQRKKAADEAEREAKATAQIQAVEQVNLQYAKDQLTNALELTVARQRGFDSLDKQLLLNELNNELSEEEVASLKRQIEQRDLNRDLADQTKGLLIDQINSIDGIVAKEDARRTIQEKSKALTDEDLTNQEKVKGVIDEIKTTLVDNNNLTEAEKIALDEKLKNFLKKPK